MNVLHQNQNFGDSNLSDLKSLPERRSLGQHVFENLKRAIIKGELPPGGRVVESRLAQLMGISRTPVREAIHKLEREGYVRQNASGAYFVAGLTRSDIEETFGIRSVLESYAAKLAAMNYKGEELKPLEEKIDECQSYLRRGEMEALLRINTEFHDLLYNLSESPRLIKMINDLKDHIYRFRRVLLKMADMVRVSNEDHRMMLELIRKRDGEAVEKLVREHVLRGRDVVLREFDSQHIDQ